jgi:membrane protein
VSSRIQGLVAKGQLVLERARARYSVVDVAVGTIKRFSRDDAGSYAAALTYYTFFSIFPLLLFGLTALAYATFGNDELQRDIIEGGREAVPLLQDFLTNDVIADLQERRRGLAVTGVVLALYSGSGAVVALEHALNRINGVVQEPNFLAKRLRSLLWLAILGGAALASVAVSAAAELVGRLFAALGDVAGAVTGVLLRVGGVAVGALLFATAYKVLPAKAVSWRDVLPGALVAGAVFELLKFVGGVYIEAGSGGRSATFGAFATAAGLLVACYLLSQITLLCAELNAVLAERAATRQSQVAIAQGGNR